MSNVLKVLQYIYDSSGNYKGGLIGGVRRLDNLTNTWQLVAPFDPASTVMASALLASGDITSDLIFLAKDTDGSTQLYGKDVVDPTDPNYQDYVDWLVWEGQIGDLSLQKISKYRSGTIQVNFNVFDLEDGVELVTEIGTFGSATSTTGGDLPDPSTYAGADGDYYRCDMPSYVSVLGGNQEYLYNEAAYFDTDEWILGSSQRLSSNTSAKSTGVGPAVSPNINSLDAEDPLTEQIVDKLNDHESRITVLEALAFGSGDTFMLSSEFEIEGTASKDVKWARNTRTSVGVDDTTALEIATVVSRVDQDVKAASSPIFVTPEVTNINVATKATIGTIELTENTTDGTLDMKLSADVTVQLAQELNQLMVNKATSGLALSNMTPVWVSGVTGNKLNIDNIDISVDAEANRTIGLITQPTIAFNASGYVTTFGFVRALDTSAFTDDDDLWVSASGGLTATKPTAPLNAVKIGVVVYAHATLGVIFVGVERIQKLQELSDVYAPTMTNGDILIWATNRFIVENYTARELDGISDVNAPSPMLGEILQYNGIEWVNGDIVTQGAGKSITWFIEDQATVPPITDYELLSEIPLGLTEEDDAVVLSSALTDTLISSYATVVLGRTKIEAGSWNFETYARVSSTNGITKIKFKVYKRITAGTETLLFESETEEINATVNQLYSIISVQSEFTILATDRIVIKYYGYTSSVANPTITMVHSGTDNASHIDTPLQTLHNDLAGLQGGSAAERYHLAAAELLKVTDGVVEKNLSNDTTYPEKTAGTIVDKTKFFMYAYDENEATEANRYKKISINETDSSANTATGSFVDSQDYAPDGLGAYKTAFTTVHTMALNGTYQVYVDVKDIAVGQMASILLPAMTVDTAIEVSFDNQTTYRQLLMNGTTVPAVNLSGKSIIIERTSAGLIYTGEVSVDSPQSYVSVIDSTFGTIAPVDGGTPQITTISGLSPNQLLIDGDDFATSFTLTNATGSVTDGVYSFTATATNGRLDQELVLQPSTTYYVVARLLADDPLVRLVSTDDTNYTSIIVAHSGSGAYEIISGTFTTTATVDNTKTRIEVRDSRTSAWTQNDVDWIMAIPITNTSYSGQTADQLNAQFQKYLDNGYTDLVNPKLKFYGINLNGDNWEQGGLVGVDNENTNTNRVKTSSTNPIPVKPSTSYRWNITNTSVDGKTVTRVNKVFLDADLNDISIEGSSQTITTPSNARYIRFTVKFSDDSDVLPSQIEQSLIMVNEGTSDETYTAYASPSDNFKLYGTAREVGSVRDTFEWVVDHYELVQRNEFYTLVEDDITAIATLSTIQSITISKPTDGIGYGDLTTGWTTVEGWNEFTSGSGDSASNEGKYRTFGATNDYVFYVALGTYATLGDAKTALAGTNTRYQLATVLDGVEVDADGSTYQEEVTTILQVGSFGTDYDITFALNQTKQRELDTINIQSNKKEISANEVSIAANTAQVAINKTNADASKVITDFITITQPVDLDEIEINSNASKVITDFITVTEAADLDKTAEYTVLKAIITDVSDATTIPASNITLSSAYTNFDKIELYIEWSNTGGSTVVTICNFDLTQEYSIAGFGAFDATNLVIYSFRLKFLSTTTASAWYGQLTNVITDGASASSTFDIVKIVGLKYS